MYLVLLPQLNATSFFISLALSLQRSADWIFLLHNALSLVSSTLSPFSSMSFITSFHLNFGLPLGLFPCAFCIHALFTTASFSFLSMCPNHRNLVSRIFSLTLITLALTLTSLFLIFSTLLIPNIHRNIVISVLSIISCSFFLSAHV